MVFCRLAQRVAKPKRRTLFSQPERDKHGYGSSVKQLSDIFAVNIGLHIVIYGSTYTILVRSGVILKTLQSN